MKYEVWIVGLEEEVRTVTLNVPYPVTSMNIKDFCCRTGVFEWKDYQKIRYRKVNGR